MEWVSECDECGGLAELEAHTADEDGRLNYCVVCQQCRKSTPPQDSPGAAQRAWGEINKTETPGHKFDQGKVQMALVPAGIIEAVGIIRTYGTNKYGDPDGWKTVEPARYRDALMRHLVEWIRDPYSADQESGHSHLWHMACNIAFLIEMEANPYDQHQNHTP
jgi:hypothetical protein